MFFNTNLIVDLFFESTFSIYVTIILECFGDMICGGGEIVFSHSEISMRELGSGRIGTCRTAVALQVKDHIFVNKIDISANRAHLEEQSST